MRLAPWLALFMTAVASLAAPATAQSVFVPRYDEPRTGGPDVSAPRFIRFLTTEDFAPLNYRDARGETAGFNVAFARAICLELGVACSMQAVPRAELEARILARRGDVAIAGDMASGRTRPLIETAPYLANPARFVVRKGRDPSDGAVGVVAGSAQALYLARFSPRTETTEFGDAGALWSALRDGTIDAVFVGAISAADRLAGDDMTCCAFASGAYTETRYFGEGYVMRLRPGDARLAAAIDGAIASLAQSGTFAELYLRFFPQGLY